MPRQIPLLAVELTRQLGNMNVQKPPITDGGNTFLAKALVYITAGALAAIPSDGVLCYGQTPDKSHTATELPPEILPRPVGEGELHYPFSPLEAEFEINLAVVTAGEPVVGATAQTLAAVAVGTQYGIAIATSGVHAGKQFLDPTETTALLFQVVAKDLPAPDGLPQASDDYNPRVRVKIIPSKIQN